ncbi:MAG: hypothetical protein WBD55_04540 [Dehalococcoidia bacterium]
MQEATVPLKLPTYYPSPGPTLPWKSATTGTAENVQEAASFARELIYAMPPFESVELRSLTYVEATVGEGRDLYDPGREDKIPDIADDVAAVIFVAHGRFEWRDLAGSATPGPVYSSRLLIIPLGKSGSFSDASDEEYDLSALGEVSEVPLPLPEWPTPVSLDTAGD